MLRQRRAVVDLARASARQRQRTLGNRNCRGIGLRNIAGRGNLAPHGHGTDISQRRRGGNKRSNLRRRIFHDHAYYPVINRHADTMRRAVILIGIIGDRYITNWERDVLPCHHKGHRFHLPGHTIGVGRVRQHIRAVARHAPRTLAFARQAFGNRHTILRDGDGRVLVAIPPRRIG